MKASASSVSPRTTALKKVAFALFHSRSSGRFPLTKRATLELVLTAAANLKANLVEPERAKVVEFKKMGSSA